VSRFLFQVINGIAAAGGLFLVAAGFSITLGLLRIANLAHGTLYLVGAYVSVLFVRPFEHVTFTVWLAGLAAGATAAISLGLILYYLYGLVSGFSAQVLVGIGFAFMAQALLQMTFGPHPSIMSTPEGLGGVLSLGEVRYPAYRLVALAVTGLVGAGMWLGFERTTLGARIRAGVEDREMLEAVGISLPPLMMATFLAGSGLSGLSGAVAAPIAGAYLGLDFETLLLALVVVVLGGAGSLKGAMLASLMVGLVDSLAKGYLPELAPLSLYGPMILVLLLRPGGLFAGGLRRARGIPA
jgi:branched-subunit amino acid ABC-type transport system permease component